MSTTNDVMFASFSFQFIESNAYSRMCSRLEELEAYVKAHPPERLEMPPCEPPAPRAIALLED